LVYRRSSGLCIRRPGKQEILARPPIKLPTPATRERVRELSSAGARDDLLKTTLRPSRSSLPLLAEGTDPTQDCMHAVESAHKTCPSSSRHSLPKVRIFSTKRVFTKFYDFQNFTISKILQFLKFYDF